MDQLWHYAIALAMGSATMVTLIANVLVVLIIYSSSKLHKKENAFIVSLAFSDLFMVPVMSLALVEYIQESWNLGEWPCKVWLALDNMCTYASILNICSISVVRYIRISTPFKYNDVVTKKAVIVVIALTWMFSAIVAYPQMTNGHLTNSTECKSNMNHDTVTLYCVGTFYVPCLLMIVIYSQLYRLSRDHLKNVQRLSMFNECRKDYKAAVTIGMMIGVFLACWIPISVFIPVSQYYKLPFWLHESCKWLAYVNSMLDPMLYSAMNKSFRQSAKSMWRYYMTGSKSSPRNLEVPVR